MQVNGILETALYVADVKKSAAFYRRLFGFRPLMETERLVALDVAGRNVLLLFVEGSTGEPFSVAGGTIPPHGPTPSNVTSGKSHFAFSISAADVDAWQHQLAGEGVAVESLVDWEGGARSIYFRDPDGHLVELATPGIWKTY